MPRPFAKRNLYLLTFVAAVAALGGSCQKPKILIDSPLNGTFLIGNLVTVTGSVQRPGNFVSLHANGVPIVLAEDLYSVEVPVDPADVFTRITVEGTLASGKTLRESVTVVVGDGVTTGFVIDGGFTDEGVGLRIADAGFGQITPIVESLSSDSLDISDLITGQNPIAQGNFGGIITYKANVVEVGFGGFGLDAAATASGMDTTVTIDDFFLEIDLDLDWLGSCTIEIETATTTLQGAFDLAPLPSDPSFADVNLVSPIVVNLGGFTSQFVSGVCDDPLIGDIINLIMGQGEIQQLMQDGFEDNLADPDGTGPADSPLAAAIQGALAGISIAGPVGEALGGVVDAPIAWIDEEVGGITLAADAAIYSASPHPDAPDLPASYTVEEPFPAFGATTPGGSPYGMAFTISTSAMNQLIKTQIENGLLQEDITEFLGVPLTTGQLVFIPEFLTEFPTNTPALIRIRPHIAPVFTGNPGPGGEFAELKIAGLGVEIALAEDESVILGIEIDMDAGVDLTFTPTGMQFALATPGGAGLGVTIVDNPYDVDETNLVGAFQQLFPLFASEFEDAIDEFPIPAFLGMELAPIEVARLPGGYIGLFADLTLAPTTSLANVTFTDLSSNDFRQQGGCWLREWRHRLSGSHFGGSVNASLKGMLGADAGCTTNDAESLATVGYQVDFDVVAVAGEQWTLDIDHSIRGALDRISDGYNDGIGFQDGGGRASFQTPVGGSYSIDSGAAVAFDFTPSVTAIDDGIGGSSSNQDVEFDGTNGVTLVGTDSASVSLVFSFDLRAFSNSNTAFPTANGDEMAIRLGKNDTIDNNFTAGQYPGMGNRNIADDGHKATIALSVAPLP